jgi:hypothetical protein
MVSRRQPNLRLVPITAVLAATEAADKVVVAGSMPSAGGGQPMRPQIFRGDLRALPEALDPLLAMPNWGLWKWGVVKGKQTKVPYQVSGAKAMTNDPTTWTTYAAVAAANARGGYDGIGFRVDAPIAAFDVDDCISSETGLMDPWAKNLITRAATYAEATVSGTGIRIIGYGIGPKVHTKMKVNDTVTCEPYRRPGGRYIVVTGNHIAESPREIVNIDAVIDEVVAELDARNGSQGDEEAETEVDAAAGDAEELPRSLVTMLHVPNTGAGEPHGGYDSRHELLFAFIMAALHRVTGKTILKACLDPAYRGCAIYEHCLENRGREYVSRQIKQAKLKIKEGLDARVADINKTYALVLAGNKSAVMKDEKVDGRDHFRLLQIGAFRDWYANERIKIGKKIVPIGPYWLCHKDRRQYQGIEFDPKPDGGRWGYYNMWRGFSVKPREGDCSKFLAHLKDNVAQGNEAHYKYIVGWHAQIVQEPHKKVGTAVVLRGPQGIGKTIVGETFGSLVENHYELVAEPRYVTGQFNSHMASLLYLHVDEGFWAGDKRAEGKLKDLITGTRHLLEFKGVDPIPVNNYIRLFMTTNQTWAVPAGFKERRFAIFDVGEDKIQNEAYFAAIVEEMNNGGREALLYHLLNFDLTQVNLRVIPKTEALLEQIIESMTPEQAWWFDTLQRGVLPRGIDEANTCPKVKLFHRYVRHAQLVGKTHKQIETMIGIFLNKIVGSGLSTAKKKYTICRRQNDYLHEGWVYVFPPLRDCRQRFADEVRQPINWGAGADNAEWEHEPSEPDDWM